jgi:hypothetical protein
MPLPLCTKGTVLARHGDFGKQRSGTVEKRMLILYVDVIHNVSC